jgi:outer membrane lipopolysaccharide assembly protein LptE/RlpB
VVSVIRARAILLLSVAITLCSCAYSLRGNLPEHLQTVKIVPFRSSVTEYGLEQELTSMVVEEMVSNGRLAVVTEEADAVLEGRVASFTRTPYSYTSAEEIEEYRLDIRVSLTFTDMVRNENILDTQSVGEWIVYDPDEEQYSDARQRLLESAADEIIRSCLSGW